MMRKTAVLFMVFFTFLVTCVMAGCSSNRPAASGSSDVSGAEATSAQTEPADEHSVPSDQTAVQDAKVPETDESAVSDWGTAEAPAGSDQSKYSSSEDASDSFSQVIADREDLYFAIKEVKTDEALGYSWKVYLENRTDKNLMFSFEKVSLNGVMCDPFWAEVIPAGQKGNAEILWMRDSLEERQLAAPQPDSQAAAEITRAEFTLNVYNDDDYTEAPLMHEPFTVYPLAKASSADTASGDGTSADGSPAGEAPEGASTAGEVPADAATPFVREPAESDLILVDNADCQIVVTGFDPDNSWGYAVKLYLRNKTDQDLIFSADNTAVNGIQCEPYWAEIVTAGNSAFSTVLWDHASLEENKITEVKEISLPLRVYSDRDAANPYVNETFELKPQ